MRCPLLSHVECTLRPTQRSAQPRTNAGDLEQSRVCGSRADGGGFTSTRVCGPMSVLVVRLTPWWGTSGRVWWTNGFSHTLCLVCDSRVASVSFDTNLGQHQLCPVNTCLSSCLCTTGALQAIAGDHSCGQGTIATHTHTHKRIVGCGGGGGGAHRSKRFKAKALRERER